MGQYRIKQAAGPAEVEVAARVVAAAMHESYVDLVSPAVLDYLTSEDYLAVRTAEWWQATADGAHLWLAQRADTAAAVAMAYANASTDPDVPTPLELKMLFALEEAHGSGLADALLRAAIGDAPAFLWTLLGNNRAIGFYRRHGFALDGTTRVADHLVARGRGAQPPTEVRLARLG